MQESSEVSLSPDFRLNGYIWRREIDSAFSGINLFNKYIPMSVFTCLLVLQNSEFESITAGLIE